MSRPGGSHARALKLGFDPLRHGERSFGLDGPAGFAVIGRDGRVCLLHRGFGPDDGVLLAVLIEAERVG